MLEQLEDIDGAVAWLRPACTLDPENGAHYIQLARLLLTKGDPSQALAAAERAVELAPMAPDSYFYLAVARHRLGQDTGARRAYLRALEIDPDHAAAKRGLAELEQESQDQ
jgi:tetratricopeptide (TPR) repeat protein